MSTLSPFICLEGPYSSSKLFVNKKESASDANTSGQDNHTYHEFDSPISPLQTRCLLDTATPLKDPINDFYEELKFSEKKTCERKTMKVEKEKLANESFEELEKVGKKHVTVKDPLKVQETSLSCLITSKLGPSKIKNEHLPILNSCKQIQSRIDFDDTSIHPVKSTMKIQPQQQGIKTDSLRKISSSDLIAKSTTVTPELRSTLPTSKQITSTPIVAFHQRRKDEKGCNCKKSKCLKFYCECFAASIYCSPTDCHCTMCCNIEGNPNLLDAIQKVMKRSPDATSFAEVSLVSARKQQNKRLYTSGTESSICFCKKSKCLKKYCECFARGIYCSDECNCVRCKNKPPKRAGHVFKKATKIHNKDKY